MKKKKIGTQNWAHRSRGKRIKRNQSSNRIRPRHLRQRIKRTKSHRVDLELFRRFGPFEPIWASYQLFGPKCNLKEIILEIMGHHDEVLYLYKCLDSLK